MTKPTLPGLAVSSEEVPTSEQRQEYSDSQPKVTIFHTHTHTQTDRQTDRLTHSYTDTKINCGNGYCIYCSITTETKEAD